MRLIGSIVFAGGCTGNPVDGCEHFPASDCCESDVDCLDFYGSEFPFCSRSDRAIGGTCGECAADRHCRESEYCYVGRFGQGTCRDPDICYEDGATGCELSHP